MREIERSRLRTQLEFGQAVRAAALAGIDEDLNDAWMEFQEGLVEKIND